MHAGGNFLHSAFYGGRIAGALTIGAATKLIKGGVGLVKGISGKAKASKNKKSEDDDSDKYSEDGGGESSETTTEGGSE